MPSWNPFNWLGGGSRQPVEVAAEPGNRVKGDGTSRTGRQRDDTPVTGRPSGCWGTDGYVRNCDAGYVDVPAGTEANYRLMDLDPVLVLSRAVITAPVREAGKSYEAREGTSDLRVRFVQEAIDPLWPEFIREALDCLSMGWKPFEAVWGVRNRYKTVVDLKPLSQETTQVLAYPGVSDYGLRATGADSGTVDLEPPYALVVTAGGHNRNPYGQSWHDAARKPWADKQRCLRDLAKLGAKASGRQGQIYYPPAADEATSHANENRAKDLLNAYMRGDGITVPNTLGGAGLSGDVLADLRNGVARPEAALWGIKLEDFGNTGAQVAGLLAEIAYHNKELSRAWHVPERAAQEGQHGTKAESEVQGEISLRVAQLVFDGICDALNRGPVNRMLADRYGESARGSVRVVGGKIRDVYAEADWKVIDALLANADGLMALADAGVDFDAILTRRGVAKDKAVLDVGKALREGAAERARRASADLARTQAEAADEALGLARAAGEEPADEGDALDTGEPTDTPPLDGTGGESADQQDLAEAA